MFHPSPARWLAALPALAALAAGAQSSAEPGEPPALDPPALPFRSAFEGYQPYADDKSIPWRDANDTVHRRGGWRAYAREAAEEGTADGDAPKTDAAPHADHSMPAPAKEARP